MKTVLSLWTCIFLIHFCESMDRRRNKICYTAMTCIHTGKEKCGVDGGGNFRRFYDSCDMLEFNCLKGKDFQKTSHDKCQNLPPIDGQNGGNNLGGVNSNNTGGIEGTITIDDKGNVGGEIVIDDKVTGTNNHGDTNTGIEHNVENNAGTVDGNKEEIEGIITVDDKGNVEGEVVIDDAIINDNKNKKNHKNDKEIEGIMTIDDNGNVQGVAKINDDNILEKTPNNNRPQHIGDKNDAIEGEIVVKETGSIEGELHVPKDIVDQNVQTQGQPKEVVHQNPQIQGKPNQDNSGIKGEINIDNEGNVEGEVHINDEIVGENENNQKIRENTETINNKAGVEGNIVINEKNIEGEITINSGETKAAGRMKQINDSTVEDEAGDENTKSEASDEDSNEEDKNIEAKSAGDAT